VCPGCNRIYPWRDGQLRCFVSATARVPLDIPLAQGPVEWPPWSPPPDGAWHDPAPPRTSPRQLSILASRGRRLDVLDWGCGRAEYRRPVADLGHRYVGVDAEGQDADVLADVHRLPFRAAAFDHVVTNAVLEHVANPFLAVAEVSRVLRSGGVFAGSAAFLEPYHHHSFFHLAPDGLLHVLRTAGLVVRGIWPEDGWLVFDSLAEMPGPVSAPTRWVLRRLGAFERRLRRYRLHPRVLAEGRRWLAARTPAEVHAERLVVSGQIDFLAEKP